MTKTDSKKSSSSSSKQEDNVASVEGIEPTLSFDIDIQHVQIRENTVIDSTLNKKHYLFMVEEVSLIQIFIHKIILVVDKTKLVLQTSPEIIDYSDKKFGSFDNVVIYADDSALF